MTLTHDQSTVCSQNSHARSVNLRAIKSMIRRVVTCRMICQTCQLRFGSVRGSLTLGIDDVLDTDDEAMETATVCGLHLVQLASLL